MRRAGSFVLQCRAQWGKGRQLPFAVRHEEYIWQSSQNPMMIVQRCRSAAPCLSQVQAQLRLLRQPARPARRPTEVKIELCPGLGS